MYTYSFSVLLVDPSNSPPRRVMIDAVNTEVLLPRAGEVEVKMATGRVLNLDFRLTSSITNASALREWRFGALPSHPPIDWQTRLHGWLEKLENLGLEAPSTLTVDARATLGGQRLQGRPPSPDAPRLIPSATAEGLDIFASAAPALSSVGASDLRFDLRLDRLSGPGVELDKPRWKGLVSGVITDGRLERAHSELRAANARAGWLTNAALVLKTESWPADATGGLQTDLTVDAVESRTPWGKALTNRLQAHLVHTLADWASATADWILTTGPVDTRWATLSQSQIAGRIAPAPRYAQWHAVDGSWGYWAMLEPFHLDWKCELRNLSTPQFLMTKLACAGQWRAPSLEIEQFQAIFPDGRIDTSAMVDISTRELRAQSDFEFGLQLLTPFLTEKARGVFSRVDCPIPPKARWIAPHPAAMDRIRPAVER